MGGVTYIEVPNLKSYDSIGWFAAPHLYSFTLNTLNALLAKNRLKVIKIEETEYGLSCFCKRTNGELLKYDYNEQNEIKDSVKTIKKLKQRKYRARLLFPLRLSKSYIRKIIESI